MDMQGNKIYAVDFDNTLSYGKWPDTGEPNTDLFRFLIEQKAAGARIILDTCRTGEALDIAIKYCKEHGLEFDAVNENLWELVAAYGEDTRKISADCYIDDKAINTRTFAFYLEVEKNAARQ